MFEQCPKRLWLSVHREEMSKQQSGAESRFASGHEVGAVACALLPNGIMVEAEPNLAAALLRTHELLNSGQERPIFEATLEHDGVLVRIDILEPDGVGAWRMAEVKSSTTAKDYQLRDLATQLWVAENARVPISSAAIRHINSGFVLKIQGEFSGLFIDTDLTAQAAQIAQDRSAVASAARTTLEGPQPDVPLGDHCNSPFECEFSSFCRAAIPQPPEWPVTILPYGGGKRWLEQNIIDLLAINPECLTSEIQRRVQDATSSGEPYHNLDGARAAMSAWHYPRTWLDFETIAFAIPRWIGTRPYQQIPFQFSAHVESSDGQIAHREFLSLDGSDPRRLCADALIAIVPPSGAVIGYNASFEKRCIIELADAFPDIAGQLRSIADRVVDLLPVVRANWYHRDQRGSWSIKAVLPTVAPRLDYSELEIKDGGSAQDAYLEAISSNATETRRREIEIGLRAYCSRDTEAMIVLASRLRNDR